MIALAIIVAVIILIALLRVGVSVEYSGDGVSVKARMGPIRVRVFPAREVSPEIAAERAAKKAIKKVAKKEAKKKRKREAPKKPGTAKQFLEMLPSVKTVLSRLRRRLLIKKLTIHYTAAGDDPYNTAMLFGAANVVFETVVPMLEKSFRIRRRDLRADVNFELDAPVIYAKAVISLAVWEAIYIVLPIAKGLAKSKTKTARKNVNVKPHDKVSK